MTKLLIFPSILQGPDGKFARKLEKEFKEIGGPSVHFHQPTFTESSLDIVTSKNIDVGAISVESSESSKKTLSKRGREEEESEEVSIVIFDAYELWLTSFISAE